MTAIETMKNTLARQETHMQPWNAIPHRSSSKSTNSPLWLCLVFARDIHNVYLSLRRDDLRFHLFALALLSLAVLRRLLRLPHLGQLGNAFCKVISE